MNEVVPLDQLVIEIKFYSQQTAQNIIETGRRLILAKKQVPYGEWNQWLKEKVNFSQKTATRFMQCAERFETMTAELSSSQMFEMLALPAAEAQEFVETKAAEGKPVEDMTVKALRQEIKEWKQRAEVAEKNSEEKIKTLSAALEEAKQGGGNAEVEKLQAQLKEAIEDKNLAEQRADDATALWENACDSAERESERLDKYIKELKEQNKELQRTKAQVVTPIDYEPMKRELMELRIEQENSYKEIKQLEKRNEELKKRTGQVATLPEETVKLLETAHNNMLVVTQFFDTAMNLPKGEELKRAIEQYLQRHNEIDASKWASVMEEIAHILQTDDVDIF